MRLRFKGVHFKLWQPSNPEQFEMPTFKGNEIVLSIFMMRILFLKQILWL